MLKAVGFSDADLKKPLIGVANTWIEIAPCNYHLRDLAVHVKAGIRAAGGTPMEFNTVSISDGITMGTEGMRASLVSREGIADAIELVALGSGSVPATDPAKAAVARVAGERVMSLVRSGIRPRDIITRTALENAIASVATTGGSTNAVLHLIAIAREAGLSLELADFDRISPRTPLYVGLKPPGRFVATEPPPAGASPLGAKRLVGAEAVGGAPPTITGPTLA